MTAETNAERLEEIKDAVDHASQFIGDMGELYFSSGEKLLIDFHWTIQQAERAQELERELDSQIGNESELNQEIGALRSENIRLREALEYYADKNILDNGEIARQALKGASEK